jgi:cytochrome c oxidase cbb3-type subunit 3
MADFTNGWLGIVLGLVVIASILGCAVLLLMQSKIKVKVGADGKPLPVETTGHVWDEDLRENNNPLPGWWTKLFYGTIIFGCVYLTLYGGVGSYKGILNWSLIGEYEAELKAGDEQYGPLFQKFMAMDIPTAAKDPQAREIGERLFLNTCAQCHGSDAQGAKGYPNLTDKDWLYGGDPQTILTTIKEGRNGMMPPMAAAVGNADDVQNVANYVLSLSASPHDAARAQDGKSKFTACAACHGADGKGNQLMGAPNLTDKIWLHGSGIDAVTEAINKGRSGHMPTFKGIIAEDKLHLIAAFVWSLSNNPPASPQSQTPTNGAAR